MPLLRTSTLNRAFALFIVGRPEMSGTSLQVHSAAYLNEGARRPNMDPERNRISPFSQIRNLQLL